MATYVNLLEIKVIFASWMEPDGMKSQSPDFISKLPADGYKYLSGKLLYTFNNCLLRDIIGLNLKVEKLVVFLLRIWNCLLGGLGIRKCK